MQLQVIEMGSKTVRLIGVLFLFVIQVRSECNVVDASTCIQTIATQLTDINYVCANKDSLTSKIPTCVSKVDTCPQDQKDELTNAASGLTTNIESLSIFCGPGCENFDYEALGTSISNCTAGFENMDPSAICGYLRDTLQCLEKAIGECKAPFIETTLGPIMQSLTPYASNCDPPLTFRGDTIAPDTSDCENGELRYLGCLLPLASIFSSTGDDMDSVLSDVDSFCSQIDKAEFKKVLTCLEELNAQCPKLQLTTAGVPPAKELEAQLNAFEAVCDSDCSKTDEVFKEAEKCTPTDPEFNRLFESDSYDAEAAAKSYDNFCVVAGGFLTCTEKAFSDTDCRDLLNPYIDVVGMGGTGDNKIRAALKACGHEINPIFSNAVTTRYTIAVIMVCLLVYLMK